MALFNLSRKGDRSTMTLLAWAGFAIAALYVGFVAFLYFAQERLMYHPVAEEPHPGLYGLDRVSPIRLVTADGLSILAWQAPPADASKPVLVLYHGNAGHLGDRAEKVRFYLDQGYGLLMPTWRYNAGAGGFPSEQGLLADARAALDHLAGEGVEASRIVLYGESLGTGLAVAMAAERPVAAVVLEAPYSSVVDVAADRYPFAPVRRLIKAHYDSTARIGRVTAPILIAHGSDDRIIPLRFARKLAAAAPEGTQFHVFEGAGHTDLDARGLQPLVADFLHRRAGF